MAITLFAGILTLAAAVAAGALWLSMPPRSICPECGRPTEPVAMGALGRPLERLVRRRWCTACLWTGYGRNGPVLWARKGPVAHDSGFRWGEDLLPPDMGFRWGAPGSTPEVLAARNEEGHVRRIITLRHAERAVGFRWGGRQDPAAPGR